MKSHDVHKLGIWLATKRFSAWERGKNDCCTLVMEWHDHRFGTNTLDEIWGKYWDLKTAIKWAKKIPLESWFTRNGYTQITANNIQDGDIAMVKHYRWFCSGYFILQDRAWGIQDDARTMTQHPVETMHEHTIWRHTTDGS